VKGFGVVASVPIKQGSIIVKDRPLLRITKQTNASIDSRMQPHLPWKKDDHNYFMVLEDVLQQQFLALSLKDRDRVMALCNAWPDELALAGIFQTCELPAHDDSALSVLCPLVSRFNSSCRQNAIWEWSESEDAMLVQALCDIEPGTEICVFYAGDQLPCRADRQKRLRECKVDECVCEACTDPDSDLRRKRIRDINLALDLLVPGQERSGYALAKEKMELYQKEGIHWTGLRQTLHDCVLNSVGAKAPDEEIKHWALQAIQWTERFAPKDHHRLRMYRYFARYPSRAKACRSSGPCTQQ